MRTLSTTTNTEVSKTITRPILLVEISFPIAYRWATLGDVTWNGYTWTSNGVRVEDIRNLAGGGVEGRISIPNHDNAASALVLGNSIADTPCVIWHLYGDGPYAVADAVELFRGVLDGAEIGLDRVSIGLTSTGRVNEVSPRLFIAPPICNKLPPRGTVLAWAGERYTLEGAQ